MAFDYKEYTLLLNQLIEKSGEMRQFRDTPLRDAIAPLCRFLRISKLLQPFLTTTLIPLIFPGKPTHIMTTAVQMTASFHLMSTYQGTGLPYTPSSRGPARKAGQMRRKRRFAHLKSTCSC